jgi:IS30 family transposase
MSYQHLTQQQRYQIATLHKEGFGSRAIGDVVECHHSTVAREIERNGGPDGYRANAAQRQAVQRRHAASTRPRIDASVWVVVDEHLREDWSPEQIVGHGIAAISIERIYQHIAEDRARGGDLWRHRRRRRRRRRIGTARQRQRFGGRRIDTRPGAIEQRRQVGHWELDSMLGNGPVRLITMVERKSRFVRLRRVANGKAATARDAIVAALYGARCCVSTLTYDNGSEFAEHGVIDIALDAMAYFAEPHSPWQRGTNENTNGLLRQYFPKGKSMHSLTDEQLQVIEDKLNNRPRKVLGFKTPREVFLASLKRRAS